MQLQDLLHHDSLDFRPLLPPVVCSFLLRPLTCTAPFTNAVTLARAEIPHQICVVACGCLALTREDGFGFALF